MEEEKLAVIKEYFEMPYCLAGNASCLPISYS
jgi:hypothetical protein